MKIDLCYTDGMTLDEARLCSHTGEAALYDGAVLVAFFAEGLVHTVHEWGGVRRLACVRDLVLENYLLTSKDWQAFGAPVRERSA